MEAATFNVELNLLSMHPIILIPTRHGPTTSMRCICTYLPGRVRNKPQESTLLTKSSKMYRKPRSGQICTETDGHHCSRGAFEQSTTYIWSFSQKQNFINSSSQNEMRSKTTDQCCLLGSFDLLNISEPQRQVSDSIDQLILANVEVSSHVGRRVNACPRVIFLQPQGGTQLARKG
jgi:hypothetical protein